MTETTRRVAVTLIAATSEPAHQVMAGMLDAVRNRLPELAIHSTTTSAFDMDEDDEEPGVFLVVDPVSGTVKGLTDGDRAHEYAGNVGAVVVELPTAADYRDGK